MNESHYLASPQFVELKAMLDALPVSIGVLRLRCDIPNYPSFFPGGRGYKEPAFPEAPVMLVGHNFDTEEGFRDSVRRGSEDHLGMNTWVNLIRYFLPEAHVEEGECFFTNFYLGAIIHAEPKPGVKKKTTNRGKFKCSAKYHSACVEALIKQIRITRPRVIALLGAKVPSAFAEAVEAYVPHCGVNLTDTQMRQPLGGHRIQILPDLHAQVVSLYHPSNPRSNESHRAQGALLGAAVKAARC
jgi:hypothetical protein